MSANQMIHFRLILSRKDSLKNIVSVMARIGHQCRPEMQKI